MSAWLTKEQLHNLLLKLDIVTNFESAKTYMLMFKKTQKYNDKGKYLFFLQRSIFIGNNMKSIQLHQIDVMTDHQEVQCLAPLQCFHLSSYEHALHWFWVSFMGINLITLSLINVRLTLI